MIFITGDVHADFNQRFNVAAFPDQKDMSKNDYVIVCGDFGIWDKSSEQKWWLDWLDEKSFTTLFVDGNHENFDMLNAMLVKEWHGGKVHFVRPSVIHLMRGQVFDISGKKFFTMGGAASHDIADGVLEPDDIDFKHKLKHANLNLLQFRVNHLSWWKEEMPCQAEYDEARKNLAVHGNKVDYIISHCAPSDVSDILSSGLFQTDALTCFLEEVSRAVEFKYWFFGHYHDDRVVKSKFIELYHHIVELPE